MSYTDMFNKQWDTISCSVYESKFNVNNEK